MQNSRVSRLDGFSRTRRAQLTDGGTTCQCAGCEEYFAGVSVFDRHLTILSCMTAAEMEEIGMKRNPNGVWQYGKSKKHVGAE